jgi:phosphomannomutase
MVRHAALAGLQSVGCEVIDVGLVPTPTVQVAVRTLGAAGGLALTASHNPVEWNALKFIGPEGIFLDPAEHEAFAALRRRGFARARWDELGAVHPEPGAVTAHLERILRLPFLDVEGLRRRAVRVVVDAVRGAGAVVLRPLLEALGCRFEILHEEPDGRFPRDPEPRRENLGELGARVRAVGAEVGFALDPDGDRLALVDADGQPVGEDGTLALALPVVLRRQPGPVVVNLSTSQVVEAAATPFGVPVLRAPVGEVHVARRMQQEGAPIGGEGNGGVIVPAAHYGRDAAVAAALILQRLLEEGRPLRALVEALGRFVILKDKAPRPAVPWAAVAERLRAEARAPEVDLQDGVRLAWPAERRWVHLRPSNTEPIVRLIAEAPTEPAARALLEQARAWMTAAAGAVAG